VNRLLDRLLARTIRTGGLEVTWSDGAVSYYGSGGEPFARLAFLDAVAETAILKNPELSLGEAYMEGTLAFPNDTLADFMLLLNENWTTFRSIPWMRALSQVRRVGQRILENNDVLHARRNVSHHYDLDERLYRLFLDSDMQYSCAYFATPGMSLEAAQLAKKQHIAAKLALKPGQKVLDIGSGWGGLGIYLAEAAGVEVTGVTLSREQHRVSNQRARERGVASRARFELRDYRTLDREFDRIVSVGMFEHVGAKHYPEFFETCRRLLKPDGVMLLHSIGRQGPAGSTNPFLAKYIFPGGYIPAVSEVVSPIEKAGLLLTDIEILRIHYAETLKAWRQRFRAHWDEAVAIYDERFCRMWDFYLAGSEAAFRYGEMMVIQAQLTRSQLTLPITRDYMAAAEAALGTIERPDESYSLAGE
jgi:cyclopropane-fatty-acyl-phospholipid synthase